MRPLTLANIREALEEEKRGGGKDLGGERLKQAEGLEGVCDAVTPGRRRRRRRGISV